MKTLFLCFFLVANAQAITFSAWEKMTQDQHIEYLSSNVEDLEVDLDSNGILENRLSPERRRIVDFLLTNIMRRVSLAETNLFMEIEDDAYALVGKVKKSAMLYFSDDNKYLGASVMYTQQGCTHQDENGDYLEESGYYSTIEEAEKNNCFDNDVSWTGYSITNHQFVEISHSDYMEWSGH